MKQSFLLFWHRLFNNKRLIQITFGNYTPEPGYLYNDEKGRTIRCVKDDWFIYTDGMYPRHLIWINKVKWFFQFTISGWYLKFIFFLMRKFPSIRKVSANGIISKILFFPVRRLVKDNKR